MNDNDIKCLKVSGNIAIAKLKCRKYPGILFQGDTVYSMLSRLKKIILFFEIKKDGDFPDEYYELEYIIEVLENAQNIYKNFEQK